MAFEDYTIQQYMDAAYKDDFSVISEETLKTIKFEYMDACGFYDADMFQKMRYIHFINNRINVINLNIRLQREFLKEFDVPYPPGLEKFRKYGHRLKWEGDKEKLENKLQQVEQRESKFVSQLQGKVKEFQEAKEKLAAKYKNRQELTKTESRASFLRNIVSLGKEGYQIVKHQTTMEELAIMVTQLNEINKLNLNKKR